MKNKNGFTIIELIFTILIFSILIGAAGYVAIAIFFGGIESGSGKYVGRIVDVSWEGIVFKSCEITQQAGENSSHMSLCSSRDENYCNLVSSHVGQVKTLSYVSKSIRIPITTQTNFICSGEIE